MTDEEALRAIIEAAYLKLQQNVVRGVVQSGDESHKIREVALKTLDELRARVVSDPAWLESVISQVQPPDGGEAGPHVAGGRVGGAGKAR